MLVFYDLPEEIPAVGVIAHKAWAQLLVHKHIKNVIPFFIVDEKISHEELVIGIEKLHGFPIVLRENNNKSTFNLKTIEELKIEIDHRFKNKKTCLIIQKQLRPLYSGKLYTIDPLSGMEERALLQCKKADYEKIITRPEFINNKTPLSTVIVNQHENKIIDFMMGSDLVEIGKHYIFNLVDLGKRIQSLFKGPQIIDWIITEHGEIFITNSHPISAINNRTDVELFIQFDLMSFGLLKITKPILPLCFSFYKLNAQKVFSDFFKQTYLLSNDELDVMWFQYRYSRLYLNIGIIHRALAPLKRFYQNELLQSLGYVVSSDEKSVSPYFDYSLLRVPFYMGLANSNAGLKKYSGIYLNNFEKKDLFYRERIKSLTAFNDIGLMNDFRKMYKEYFSIAIGEYVKMSIYTMTRKMALKHFLSLIKFEKFEELTQDLENKNMINFGQDQKKLKTIFEKITQKGALYDTTVFLDSEFSEIIGQIVARYYYYAADCFDLNQFRLGENPHILAQLYNQSLENVPVENIEIKAEIYDLIAKLPFYLRAYKKRKFEALLKSTRSMLVNQNLYKEFCARSFFIMRLYLIEIATRLHQKKLIEDVGDIFYLKIDELIEIQDPNYCWGLLEKIKYRKGMDEAYRDFEAPISFGKNIRN